MSQKEEIEYRFSRKHSSSRSWLCIYKNSVFTDHDGDVMAVMQWQGAVHVQDVVLCAQEALQVLRVRGHLLGHGVHAPRADQSLHEQQRHSLLLTIHHHLQKPGQIGARRLVSDGWAEKSVHRLVKWQVQEQIWVFVAIFKIILFDWTKQAVWRRHKKGLGIFWHLQNTEMNQSIEN